MGEMKIFLYDCCAANDIGYHQVALIVKKEHDFCPVRDGGKVRELIWDNYQSNVMSVAHGWSKGGEWQGPGSAILIEDVIVWLGR